MPMTNLSNAFAAALLEAGCGALDEDSVVVAGLASGEIGDVCAVIVAAMAWDLKSMIEDVERSGATEETLLPI